MSWPMQNTGQWNPGVVPPMTTVPPNMGNYTPEQWTLMQQQQNWQWTQWQQYAQWQNTQAPYGDKMAQMPMQAMGGMPPLPTGNVPMVPPPPSQPPPPPPHENNQPLYGNNQVPTPASQMPTPSASTRTQDNASNLGNNQQWSNTDTTQHSVLNADALKKLAEEERLFDIQFQKWEEEIEKWKRENADHPDKQAYIEYEKKFESCRAQLLERRKQMNLKKSKLLGTDVDKNVAASSSQVSQPPPAAVAQPVQNPRQPQKIHSNPPQMYSNQQHNYSNQQQNYPNQQQNYSKQQQNYSNQQQNYSNQQQNYPKQQQNNYPNHQQQDYSNQQHENYSNRDDDDYSNEHQNYSNQSQQQNYTNQQQKYTNQQQKYTNHGNLNSGRQNNNDRGPYNKPIELQNRYDDNMGEDNSNSNSTFLPSSATSGKGIPGLDLVPEDRGPIPEVIDITDEKKGPDYKTISKGINHILGDEKIMNILSMVVSPSKPDTANKNYQQQGGGNYNNVNNQQQANSYNNQNQMNYPMQGQSQNSMQQNFNQNSGYGPQVGSFNQPREYPQNQQGYPPNSQRPPQPLLSRNNPGMPQDQRYNENVPQGNYGNTSMNNMGRDGPMRLDIPNNVNTQVPPPCKPKWVEEPMFTPSIIVEYEHKPLRLKARDFIEPVHTFDYNHKSNDDNYKRREIEKVVEEEMLFSRKPRRAERDYDEDIYSRRLDRHGRERQTSRDFHEPRDFERRVPLRDEPRDDWRSRPPPRDAERSFEPREERNYESREEERRRPDDRHDDRRRDDRDRFPRREDSFRERERERDRERDRDRERERDRDRQRDKRDDRIRSKSRDKDTRKRGISLETERSVSSKKSKDSAAAQNGVAEPAKHVVMIDDLLEAPGRDMRPDKIVIILRGPPGSGKSYLAKLIRDKEAEYKGTARIMSIDDYFVQEVEIEENDPATGKMVKKSSMKYEYDEKLEENYLTSLKRAFKRTLTDGYFNFLIYDAVNDQLKSYADIWNYARQNGFQVYICTLERDPQVCYRRNIHNRTLDDIQIISSRFFETPAHHIQLDPTSLLQNAAIPEVHMEDVEHDTVMEDAYDEEVEQSFISKWERMDDAAKIARLDGTFKPLRASAVSMEDYLQLDEWKPTVAKPGKKSVRWADIEERRQQEKMRAIGFVVGQTDWNRMTDPTMGSSALTQTKYIERVKRN